MPRPFRPIEDWPVRLNTAYKAYALKRRSLFGSRTRTEKRFFRTQDHVSYVHDLTRHESLCRRALCAFVAAVHRVCGPAAVVTPFEDPSLMPRYFTISVPRGVVTWEQIVGPSSSIRPLDVALAVSKARSFTRDRTRFNNSDDQFSKLEFKIDNAHTRRVAAQLEHARLTYDLEQARAQGTTPADDLELFVTTRTRMYHLARIVRRQAQRETKYTGKLAALRDRLAMQP